MAPSLTKKCHCGTKTATAAREPHTGLWKSELARHAPALKVHSNDGVQVGSKRAHPEQKIFGKRCEEGTRAAGRSLSRAYMDVGGAATFGVSGACERHEECSVG